MSRGEREPSVPCPLLSPPPDGGILPPWVRRPPARRQQLSLRTKQKHRLKVDAFTSGAADEARTRYLHLGKVALYQMSYIRICGASGRNRTTDTGIFSPLLYRLSYRGVCCLAKCLFSIVEFWGNVKRFFEKSFCGIFKAFSKMCARTHTGRVYAQKTCGGSGAPLAQGRRLMVS